MNLLYAMPASALLLGGIVLAVLLACGGHIAVRRAFPKVDFRAQNEVAAIVLNVTGSLFAVTVAFIIAIVWQQHIGSAQRLAGETAAANSLWHGAGGLRPPLSGTIRRDAQAYAGAMLGQEWPAMRRGESSAVAARLLDRMYEEAVHFRPAHAGEANAQDAVLGHLAVLHDARRHRLDDNEGRVSPFEWEVLLIGACVVMGLCYLVGLSNLHAQLVMTGGLALMIATLFVLIFELDAPFRGDLAIAPTGWAEFVERHR